MLAAVSAPGAQANEESSSPTGVASAAGGRRTIIMESAVEEEGALEEEEASLSYPEDAALFGNRRWEEEEHGFSDSKEAPSLGAAAWAVTNGTGSSTALVPHAMMESAGDFEEGAVPVMARPPSAAPAPEEELLLLRLLEEEGRVVEEGEEPASGEQDQWQWGSTSESTTKEGAVPVIERRLNPLPAAAAPAALHHAQDSAFAAEPVHHRMDSLVAPLRVNLEPGFEEEEEKDEQMQSEREMAIDAARMSPPNSPEEPLPPLAAVLLVPLMPPGVEMESSGIVDGEGEELQQQDPEAAAAPLLSPGLERESSGVVEDEGPQQQREPLEPEAPSVLPEVEMEIDAARAPPVDSHEEPLPPLAAALSVPLMPPGVEMESSGIVDDEGEELQQQDPEAAAAPLSPGLQRESSGVVEDEGPQQQQRERLEPELGDAELAAPSVLPEVEMEIDAARAPPLDSHEEPQAPPPVVLPLVPLMPPGVEMESSMVVEDEGEELQQQQQQQQQPPQPQQQQQQQQAPQPRQQQQQQQQQPPQPQQPQQQQQQQQQQPPEPRQQQQQQQQQPPQPPPQQQQQQEQQQKEPLELEWEDSEATTHMGLRELQSEALGAPAPQPDAVDGRSPPPAAAAAFQSLWGKEEELLHEVAPAPGSGGAASAGGASRGASLQATWNDLLSQQPEDFVWGGAPAAVPAQAEAAVGGAPVASPTAAAAASGSSAASGSGSLQATWNDLLSQQPEEFVWSDPPAAVPAQARVRSPVPLPNVSKLACCSQFRELLAEDEGETETDTSTTTMTETSTTTEESAVSKTESSSVTSTITSLAGTTATTTTTALPTSWTSTVTETGTTWTSTTTPHTTTRTTTTTVSTVTATSTTTPHTTTESTTTTLTSKTATSSTTGHTTTQTSSSTVSTVTWTSTTTLHTTTQTSSSTVSTVTWTSTTSLHTTTQTSSSTVSTVTWTSTTTLHTTTQTESSTTTSSSASSTTTGHTTTSTTTWSSTTLTSTTTTTTETTTTETTTTATTTTETSTSSTTTTLDIAALLAIAHEAEDELLESLWADFAGNTSVTAPVTTMVGVTLAAVFSVSNDSTAVAEIDMPGTNVKVGIPASVLLQASNGLGAAAAAVSQLTRSSGTSSPPLSIRLLSPDGEVLEGVELASPITITLGGDDVQVGDGSCAFWDPDTGLWSTEGLTDVAGEDGELLCETIHLSLFAIIESVGEVLQCTNVKILTKDGLESFWSTHWLKYPASIGFFVLIVAHLAVLVAILWVDKTARRKQAWDDELFLTNDMSLLDQRGAAQKAKETVRSTFTYEFCVRQVALEAISYELRISPEDLKYVLSRGAEKLQANFTEALNRLAPRILEAFWNASFLRRCWVLVLIHHPWSRLRLISIRKGHFTRMLIVFGQIFGSLMLDALFFVSAGLSTSYKSGPRCEPQSTLEKTVRFVVVGFVSSALTTFMLFAVPKLLSRKRFLYAQDWSPTKKRRQLKIWKTVEWLLQLLLVFYVVASIFYILLFLANVTENTGVAWAVAAVTSVIRDLLLGPMALSAVIVLGASAARRWHPTPLRIASGDHVNNDEGGQDPQPINLCEVVSAVRPFSQMSAESNSGDGSPRARGPGTRRLRGILGVLQLDHSSIGLHCPRNGGDNDDEDENGGALSPILPVQPRGAWELEPEQEQQDDAAAEWQPSGSMPLSWQEAAELGDRWAAQSKETEALHDRYLSALGACDEVPHSTSSEALHDQYLSALGGGIGIGTVEALAGAPGPSSSGSSGEDDWAGPVREEERHDTVKHALMGYATKGKNDWLGQQASLEGVPEALEVEISLPGAVGGDEGGSGGGASPLRKAKSVLQTGAEVARQALGRPAAAAAAERPGSAPSTSSSGSSQQFQAVVPTPSTG